MDKVIEVSLISDNLKNLLLRQVKYIQKLKSCLSMQYSPSNNIFSFCNFNGLDTDQVFSISCPVGEKTISLSSNTPFKISLHYLSVSNLLRATQLKDSQPLNFTLHRGTHSKIVFRVDDYYRSSIKCNNENINMKIEKTLESEGITFFQGHVCFLRNLLCNTYTTFDLKIKEGSVKFGESLKWPSSLSQLNDTRLFNVYEEAIKAIVKDLKDERKNKLIFILERHNLEILDLVLSWCDKLFAITYKNLHGNRAISLGLKMDTIKVELLYFQDIMAEFEDGIKENTILKGLDEELFGSLESKYNSSDLIKSYGSFGLESEINFNIPKIKNSLDFVEDESFNDFFG